MLESPVSLPLSYLRTIRPARLDDESESGNRRDSTWPAAPANAVAGTDAPQLGIGLTDNANVKEQTMPAKRMTIQERREIFQALVQTQDTGMMTVPQSREYVCKHYDITDAQLRQIEDEGLEKEWPPLNEAVQEVG
jgi:hypothetical protein